MRRDECAGPDGDVLEGSMPANKLKLAQAWMEIHRDELVADWELAVSGLTTLQDRTVEVTGINPRVQAVVPEANHRLRLTFTNGEVRVYDCSGLLEFGVFKEFQDAQYFQRVRVAFGTVVWPNEQDICPDTLYLDAQPLAEVPDGEMHQR